MLLVRSWIMKLWSFSYIAWITVFLFFFLKMSFYGLFIRYFPTEKYSFPLNNRQVQYHIFPNSPMFFPLTSSHFSLSHISSPLLCYIFKMLPLIQLPSWDLNSIIFSFFSFHLNVSVWNSSMLDTSRSGSLSKFCSLKSLTNQSSEALVPLLCS